MKSIYITIICTTLLSCQNDTKKSELEKNNTEIPKQSIVMEDSTYVRYYKNGSRKIIANIKNRKFHGKYIKLYENGKIAEIGVMVNGLKNGVWKHYNENATLIEVGQYYNDSLLYYLDKSDFSFLPQAIEQEKINISMPLNWQIGHGDDPSILLVSQKKCETTIFCPNIILTKEILKKNMDFSNYLQISFELLQKRLPFFKPVAKGEITIDNLSAFQITYLMQVNGVKLGGITTWINNDSIIYIITGMANNESHGEFLKYKGLFKEITDSFKRY